MGNLYAPGWGDLRPCPFQGLSADSPCYQEGSVEVAIDPAVDKLGDRHLRGLLRHEPYNVGFKLQAFAPGMDLAECILAETPNSG